MTLDINKSLYFKDIVTIFQDDNDYQSHSNLLINWALC